MIRFLKKNEKNLNLDQKKIHLIKLYELQNLKIRVTG